MNMNFTLTQIKYLLAVARTGSFQKAATVCHVTQPTLSMQIQKIESILGVQIFDRNLSPIQATPIGKQLLHQCHTVVSEAEKLMRIAADEVDSTDGLIRIGVIPTVAPYLIPYFTRHLINQYPKLEVELVEWTTERLVDGLEEGQIDIAILATPLLVANLSEIPLYYEPFLLYVHDDSPYFKKDKINPKDLRSHDLLILNEGHCMRSQMLQLCQLRHDQKAAKSHFSFSSGSIETLLRLVEEKNGYTIVPKLATDLLPRKGCRLIEFEGRPPVRQVSLVHHKSYTRRKVLEALHEVILASLPDDIFQGLKGLKLLKIDMS